MGDVNVVKIDVKILRNFGDHQDTWPDLSYQSVCDVIEKRSTWVGVCALSAGPSNTKPITSHVL